MKTTILAIIVSVAMFACSTSGKKGSISPKDVVGQYEAFVELEQTFDTTDSATMAALEELKSLRYDYLFGEDGTLINTVTVNGQSQTANLTWALDGDTLIIAGSEMTDIPLKMAVKKTGTGLELKSPDFSQKLVKKN